MSDNTLVIINSSPYESSQAQDGLDFVMAATAFDLPVKILFQNDGILNLLAKNDSVEFLKAAELYEVNPIFINESHLKKHGIDLNDISIKKELIELVDERKIASFYENFKNILTY